MACAMSLLVPPNYCLASSFPGHAPKGDVKYHGEIVRFADTGVLDSLENEGVKILRHRGDLALALFPDNSTRASSENRRVRPRGRKIYPAMDQARLKYDAFRVTEGTYLTPALQAVG